MGTIVRSALVGHGAPAMYALVENIEAYPEFLPWCRSTQVVERREDHTIARLSVGLKGINQAFTTHNSNRPGESIELRLVEGPFRTLDGEWRFTRLGTDGCRIDFRLDYEFSNKLLEKIAGPVFGYIAGTLVDSFLKRADQLYSRQ